MHVYKENKKTKKQNSTINPGTNRRSIQDTRRSHFHRTPSPPAAATIPFTTSLPPANARRQCLLFTLPKQAACWYSGQGPAPRDEPRRRWCSPGRYLQMDPLLHAGLWEQQVAVNPSLRSSMANQRTLSHPTHTYTHFLFLSLFLSGVVCMDSWNREAGVRLKPPLVFSPSAQRDCKAETSRVKNKLRWIVQRFQPTSWIINLFNLCRTRDAGSAVFTITNDKPFTIISESHP